MIYYLIIKGHIAIDKLKYMSSWK